MKLHYSLDTGSLLRAVSITKSFAGITALRSASFDLREGEVHALIGENGAGKSTFKKIATEALKPDGGELWILGEKREDCDSNDAYSLGVAAIYQQPQIFPHLTVAENIAIALETGLGHGGWIGRDTRFKLKSRWAAGSRIDPRRHGRATDCRDREGHWLTREDTLHG